VTRAEIVAAARTWIGTPYAHQQSAKDAGCDCLGLIRGVWRDCVGAEPEPVPPYAEHWHGLTNRELLYDALKRHLTVINPARVQAGDVLLFRLSSSQPMQHAGIATAERAIVHSWRHAPVREDAIPDYWRRRIAAALSFPGAA
jgi:NlpC/P60 family putative phage cell wall peptidase